MTSDTDGAGKAESGAEPAAKRGKTGLLIIRAWLEQGSSQPLRADIRATTDVSAGFERSLTVTHADEVGAAVNEWLAEVLADMD